MITSDIDLNGRTISPAGNFENPFNGHLCGNGHIIKNFKITQTDNQYCGVFGYVKGTIEKLGFDDVTIKSTVTQTGHYYVGVIAYLDADGVISNVYCKGTITISGGYNIYAGGLIGYQNGGITSNCYSTCTVQATNSQTFAYAGGLIGCLNGGQLNNSFATGNVTANGSNEVYSRNGGLVGHNNGCEVTNCYRSYTQTLTRYSQTNTAYNTDGTVLDLSTKTCAELIELLGWDTEVWSSLKSLPLLIK